MTTNISELIVLTLLLAGAGVFGGLLAGLLGVGGGIVMVPAFYYVFTALGFDEDVKMKLAVATSLAGIVPTASSSMRAHFAKGAVDKDLLRDWGPWIGFGAIIGTVLASFVRGSVLTTIFATVALLVAAHMAFTSEGTHLRNSVPTGAAKVATASLIGTISAMMGIGGGTLTVPVLSLCGYPIRRAVATSSALGLIIAVPATIGFIISGLHAPHRPPFTLGYVNGIGFAITVPAMIVLAPYGAELAHTIKVGRLRKAFAVFLAITSLRMIYGLLHLHWI